MRREERNKRKVEGYEDGRPTKRTTQTKGLKRALLFKKEEEEENVVKWEHITEQLGETVPAYRGVSESGV